jgi:hypothetical protein
MDAFEQIVGMLLERKYWVQTSYKVRLSKPHKRKIGIPSCPRWEIDVVAYRPKDNEVLAIECKSFLNSPGVRYRDFCGKGPKKDKAYKLFTQPKLREVILDCLKAQLLDDGLIPPSAKVKLCLAAGHIANGDRANIRQRCEDEGWGLFDEAWFGQEFARLVKADYENDIAVVAAKLGKLAATKDAAGQIA